jgi:hypothetical protein
MSVPDFRLALSIEHGSHLLSLSPTAAGTAMMPTKSTDMLASI